MQNFAPNVSQFPSLEVYDETVTPSWSVKIGNILGVVDMPTQPRIWGFNPAVITLLILIGGILLSAGYYVGRQSEQINNIQRQAEDAKNDAKKAKDIALGSAEEPTPTPVEKEKRKK